MKMALKRLVEQFSFSREFLMVGMAVTLVIMLVFGGWIGNQIESRVVHRTGQIASIYVESIVTAQLRGWSGSGALSDEAHVVLDRVFIDGTSRSKVLGFRLWTTDGRILYSGNHDQVGRAYPIGEMLAAAFTGTVQSRIADLVNGQEPDLKPESGVRQLEIYVPVRIGSTRKVSVVAEFDHSMDGLDSDIRSSQLRAWAMTALFTLAIYALIFGRVHRASNTIVDQQRTLQEQVLLLRRASEDNQRMRQSLSEAGAQTTALSEQYLNRVAADLHDGPAQELAYALLRFDDLAAACSGYTSAEPGAQRDQGAIRQALQTSLAELRSITAGLGVPGIDDLSLAETAQRAVRDAEHRSACPARAEIDATLGPAPLALKIIAYRVIRESLANCWRYAGSGVPEVCVRRHDAEVMIEIMDQGAGFDPAVALTSGRLGLLFMRERVRLAGGVFDIDSAPGRGTTIRARIPLSQG
jgi:signal transduction histidine kinase